MKKLPLPLQNCYSFFEKYQSCFHPKSRLIYDVHSAFVLWRKFSIEFVDAKQRVMVKEITDYSCKWTNKDFQFTKANKNEIHQPVDVISYLTCPKKQKILLSIKDMEEFVSSLIDEIKNEMSSSVFFGSKEEDYDKIVQTNPIQAYLLLHHENCIEDHRCLDPEKRKQYLMITNLLRLIVQEIQQTIKMVIIKINLPYLVF